MGADAAADIEKDLGRTFPTLKRFAAAEGQEALRRVLRAYAAYDPEVSPHPFIVSLWMDAAPTQ